jgi:antitoxin component YwqK of YwqJK toxin-antitoxin module
MAKMRGNISQISILAPIIFLVAGFCGCSAPPTTLEDLKETDGRFHLRKSGQPYTGKVVAFHDRNQKRWERTLSDGLPHGLEVAWDSEGSVVHEMSWQNGKLREWLGSDQLFEDWFVHNKAGELVDTRTHLPFTGKITWLRTLVQKNAESYYQGGLQEGPFTRWHANGQESCRGIVRGGNSLLTDAWDLDGHPTLVDGSGWLLLFYPDGSEKEVIPYEQGILEGQKARWHPNGQKKSEIFYIKGAKHGLEKEWHENGNIRWERNWLAGELHGVDTWWSSEGQILSRSYFEYGKPVVKD